MCDACGYPDHFGEKRVSTTERIAAIETAIEAHTLRAEHTAILRRVTAITRSSATPAIASRLPLAVCRAAYLLFETMRTDAAAMVKEIVDDLQDRF